MVYKPLVEIPKEELTILVAQQFDLLRNMLVSMLKESGYVKIGTCNNGSAAKAMLENQRFHALIADMDLPGIDGLNLLRKLRKHENESLQQIPILITSNESYKASIQNIVKAGADSFLVKPFDRQGLHEGLIKALMHRDEVKPL